MNIKVVILICFSVFISACSNLITYPNDLAKNIFIKTKTDSGSVFSSVDARVDIYDVDNTCQAKYIGTVKLDKSDKKIGLRNNNLNYLDFRFISSGFLSSSNSSTGFPALIKIRKGYMYDITVSYVDDLYNVEIREKRSLKAKGREIEALALQDCKKLLF